MQQRRSSRLSFNVQRITANHHLPCANLLKDQHMLRVFPRYREDWSSFQHLEEADLMRAQNELIGEDSAVNGTCVLLDPGPVSGWQTW